MSAGAIVAGASIAVAAVAAVGLGRAATPEARVAQAPPARPPRVLPQPSGNAAAARAAFALFAAAPSRIPHVLARLHEHTDPRFTRVRTMPDGTVAYVASNATSICFGELSPSGVGGGSCTTSLPELDALAAGHVGGSITKAHRGFRVMALVPDGTTDARLTVGRTTRRLPIVDNLIYAATRHRPRSLTWTAPDGTTTGSPAFDLFAKA